MATSKPAKVPKHTTPTKVGEFTILPLTLPKLPGLPSACSDAKHYLYIRAHAPTNPTPTTDRSLFIANVPVDASEGSIRRLFAEQLGGARVESVEFDSAIPAAPARKRFRGEVMEKEKGRKRKRDEEIVAEGVVEDEESAFPRVWTGELRKSGSAAVVVFVDRESRKGALKDVQRAVRDGTEVRWKGGEKGLVGVERYKSHLELRYPQPTLLLATTTAYLAQFDAVVQSRNRLLAASRAVPDEDGFITVTRGGGRTAPAARIEQAEQKRAEHEARKQKNGVKDDFYRFQNRERRKEEEMKLKRDFERDRKRVAEMRERRGVLMPEE